MPTSETGLDQGSNVTSYLHTFLLDAFFPAYMEHHEGKNA